MVIFKIYINGIIFIPPERDAIIAINMNAVPHRIGILKFVKIKSWNSQFFRLFSLIKCIKPA